MKGIDSKVMEACNEAMMNNAKRPNAFYRKYVERRIDYLVFQLERLKENDNLRVSNVLNELNDFAKDLVEIEKEPECFEYLFRSNLDRYFSKKQFELLNDLLQKYKAPYFYWDITRTFDFIEDERYKYREGLIFKVKSGELMYVVYIFCRLADKKLICPIWKDVIAMNELFEYKGKSVTKEQLRKKECDIRHFALMYESKNGEYVGFSNTKHNIDKYKRIKEIDDVVASIIAAKTDIF